MSRKTEWEDDGRTIADMSGVERPRLLVPRLFRNHPEEETREENQEVLSPRERRMAILGAMGASLLIAGIFLLGIGLMILLLLRLWS